MPTAGAAESEPLFGRGRVSFHFFKMFFFFFFKKKFPQIDRRGLGSNRQAVQLMEGSIEAMTASKEIGRKGERGKRGNEQKEEEKQEGRRT